MQVSIIRLSAIHAISTYRFRNNPELWKYAQCDAPLPATYESEYKYYSSLEDDKSVVAFAICDGNSIVGVVKLKNIANGAAELSYYILDTEKWGKGIATEAVEKAIDFGFAALDLDLIYRYVHDDNVASVKVTKKHKFAPVGRSFINPNVVRYEITKQGWKNQKNSQRNSQQSPAEQKESK